jgi:hypothetical protein
MHLFLFNGWITAIENAPWQGARVEEQGFCKMTTAALRLTNPMGQIVILECDGHNIKHTLV